MKRIIAISFFIAIAFSISAQKYFELTPSGFVDVNDDTKNYVVLNFEGKTQQQLYEMYLAELTKMYVSAKNVISTAQYTTITANGFTDKTVSFNSQYYYDMNYTIIFQFKDEKVRIDGMVLNRVDGRFGSATNYKELFLSGYGSGIFPTKRSIFSSEGKLQMEKQKEQLEEFFNGIVDKMKNIEINAAKENW